MQVNKLLVCVLDLMPNMHPQQFQVSWKSNVSLTEGSAYFSKSHQDRVILSPRQLSASDNNTNTLEKRTKHVVEATRTNS